MQVVVMAAFHFNWQTLWTNTELMMWT